MTKSQKKAFLTVFGVNGIKVWFSTIICIIGSWADRRANDIASIINSVYGDDIATDPQRMYCMNIYVGNLPYSMDDNELRSVFTEYGTVESASVVRDKFTGRSRGFGFVEMPDSDGNAAIEATNGRSVAGRNLVVNEARPREQRPRMDRDRGPRN